LDRVRRMCCWLRWKKGTRMQFYQPLYDLRSLWRRRHQPPYTHYLPLYPHTLAELAIPSLPSSPPLNLAKPATYPHSPHSLTLRRSLLLPPLNSRNYARLARDLAFQVRNTWKSQLGYAVFWNESFKTIEPALLSLLLQLLPLLRWSSVRHLKTHKSHFPTPLPLNNPLAPSLHVLHPLMYNNSTSTCSGRGKCVEASKAGRTCFVCNCGKTTTGEGNKIKTDYWAGESCERKDISGPFVLLSGTVIVMVLLIVGSISLLYGVGDHPLPSTLLATAVNVKKD